MVGELISYVVQLALVDLLPTSLSIAWLAFRQLDTVLRWRRHPPLSAVVFGSFTVADYGLLQRLVTKTCCGHGFRQDFKSWRRDMACLSNVFSWSGWLSFLPGRSLSASYYPPTWFAFPYSPRLLLFCNERKRQYCTSGMGSGVHHVSA